MQGLFRFRRFGMALRSLEETKPFVVVDSIVFINYATIIIP